MEEALGSNIDSTNASEMLAVAGVVGVLVVMIIPLPSILLDFSSACHEVVGRCSLADDRR